MILYIYSKNEIKYKIDLCILYIRIYVFTVKYIYYNIKWWITYNIKYRYSVVCILQYIIKILSN